MAEQHLKENEKQQNILEIEKIFQGSSTNFNEGHIKQYFERVLRVIQPNTPAAYRLCSAFASRNLDELQKFGFAKSYHKHTDISEKSEDKKEKDKKEDTPKKVYPSKEVLSGVLVPQEDIDAIEQYVATLKDYTDGDERPVQYQNFIRLADLLGVDELGKEILTFLYVSDEVYLNDFVRVFANRDLKVAAAFVAMAIGRPEALDQVQYYIGNRSPFVEYGLMTAVTQGGINILPSFEPSLLKKIDEYDLDDNALIESVVGDISETELTLEDFAFLGDDLPFLVKLIKNGCDRSEKGLNILIHGPVGGGKTELAKALAKAAGKKLYAVGERREAVEIPEDYYDEDGDMTTRVINTQEGSQSGQMRISKLQRAQAFLKNGTDSLTLFDELEDLLLKGTDSNKAADMESKIEVNRMLENNPVPSIWIGNDVDKLHGSVRDRFTFTFYVDYPPALVRKKIWERQLELNEMSLSENDVMDLARQYDASPRQVMKAVKAYKLADGDMHSIYSSLPASARISHNSSEAISSGIRVPKNFDKALLEMDKPEFFEDVLALHEDKVPFSVLISGAEGAGKRTSLQYIGEQMSRNVISGSMAVLSQPTQFSTPEMNVQAVFEAAAENKSLLVINDLEYLVEDPDGSVKQWENNSLVETFLNCARNHSLAFAATTSRKSKLPDEILAVFTEQNHFRSLSEDKALKAFEVYFGAAYEGDAPLPEGLVLKDFKLTQARLKRLRPTEDQGQIVEILKEFQRYRTKPEKSSSMTFVN